MLQYSLSFGVFDSLVILENGQLEYHGPWSELNERATHLHRRYHTSASRKASLDQVEANQTVQARRLKVAEAIDDLSRLTGDFSLYRECSTTSLL